MAASVNGGHDAKKKQIKQEQGRLDDVVPFNLGITNHRP
jgi:hypothetical protein